MSSVIALEGSWSKEAQITWGAAAVSTKTGIRNSFSGQLAQLSEIDRLVSEGALTRLPEEIEIRSDYIASPLVVTAIRFSEEAAWAHLFLADTGRLGGLAAHRRTSELQIYVFKDRLSFDRYSKEIASKVARYILDEPNILDESSAEEDKAILRAALILCPHDPFIHGLRVINESLEEQPRIARFARASLRGDQDRQAFDLFVQAYNASKQEEYCLNYSGGIASLTGLDVNVAVEQLSALNRVHGKLKPELGKILPFIDPSKDIPQMRVKTLRAASAHIGIGARLDGDSTIQSIARYFELATLGDILAGDIPAGLKSDAAFLATVRKLAQPTADTKLSQRRLGSSKEEPTSVPAAINKPEKTDQLTLFGFTQGIYDNTNKVELRLRDGEKTAATFRQSDDGQRPSSDFFRKNNDFLFRPALFTIHRSFDDKGRDKYQISSARIIKKGESALINAMPSCAIANAYLTGCEAEIQVAPSGSILANGETIDTIPQKPTLPAALTWLARFNLWCKKFELDNAFNKDFRWSLPSKRPRTTALTRLLVALKERSGSGLISDIIADIDQSHEISVRQNNTRREAIKNPELIKFDPLDNNRITLTPQGKAMLSIYRRANLTSRHYLL